MAIDPNYGGDGGFIVHPELLGGVAAQIGNAGDEFSTAADRYDGQACPASSAFGSAVAAAWSDFHGAWADDLHVTRRQISELGDMVALSRQSYSTAETDSISAIKLVGR